MDSTRWIVQNTSRMTIGNSAVVQPQGPGFVPSATGTSLAPPAVSGSVANTANPLSSTPRVRLRDLASPVGEDGAVDPHGQFGKRRAAVIYREQQKWLIAVKFSVRGRDLASALQLLRPPRASCRGIPDCTLGTLRFGPCERRPLYDRTPCR